MVRRTALSRNAWIDAALALVDEEGLEKLAVEPLARRLGATKGSFYWHFSDRDDLIRSTLAAWEQRHTLAVIDRTQTVPPEQRLRHLIEGSVLRSASARAERSILFSDDPLAAPVVARVQAARIRYLTTLLVARGLPPDRADARARVTYAAFLGNLQLVAGSTPEPVTLRRFADEVLTVVTAP